MTMATLNQIEENINHLPLIEQLWLLEHLARQLRENLMGQSSLEAQLVAMALDPEIQNELREIEREFAVAEDDGLEEV